MEIGMISALFVMPLFGYVNDKKKIDRQLVIVYSLRCVANLFFFFNRDPKSPLVWVAAILTIISANLEGLAAYSFWVKRMPKDIRGILNGYFNSFARTGQLVVSLSAFSLISRYSLQSIFLVVAIGDFSVAICSFFLSRTNVFKLDVVEGDEGQKKHAKAKQDKAEKRAQKAVKRDAADQTTAANQVIEMN